MSPDRSFLDKIDPFLQDKLANAPENEILRVIMRLSGENKSNLDLNSISPADFPNRIEYRKALISARQKQLAGDIGATKQALENLALKTYGGENTRSLVVEGTVNQILHSLELSGIESANLDRGFTPITPLPNSFELNPLEPIFWEIAEKAKLTSKTTTANRIAKLLGRSDSSPAEKSKQLISQTSQQYAAQYYKKYGTLKVLGMKQSVILDSIYTNVRLLEKSEAFRFKTIEELERRYRQNQKNFESESFKVRKGLELANKEQYLLVLGAPGAGKSTYLKKIALEAFKGNKGEYKHFLIPIFIELKRFNKSEINIFDILDQELKNCGFLQSKKYIKTGLETGSFLIIFDGLDEVPTRNLESVIQQINNFVNIYKNNRFILSCRTALNQSFAHFTEVVMADFNNKQIKQFIENWFQSENDKQVKVAEKCWQLLQSEKNKNAKELAQTPLLLTFFCCPFFE
ncbi:MAG: NACHT domain-containing protein [Cyanobacteria bacterium P01_F01_bin.143]